MKIRHHLLVWKSELTVSEQTAASCVSSAAAVREVSGIQREEFISHFGQFHIRDMIQSEIREPESG